MNTKLVSKDEKKIYVILLKCLFMNIKDLF